ncbi:trypsin-like peptidase domain-containing protein, partial [Actinophytocola sp.]|uniref:trypsin-like peptidase domain-containing protein n=1 Tax=Actinophytocola sp. TaxID=1872138 RepID=UPI0039C88B1E
MSDDAELLDAYSRTVSAVAARLTPHVASVSLDRGGGSAVVFDEAGHLLTNAHVVDAGRRGTATFSDGTETPFQVVGTDP